MIEKVKVKQQILHRQILEMQILRRQNLPYNDKNERNYEEKKEKFPDVTSSDDKEKGVGE